MITNAYTISRFAFKVFLEDMQLTNTFPTLHCRNLIDHITPPPPPLEDAQCFNSISKPSSDIRDMMLYYMQLKLYSNQYECSFSYL